MRTHLGTLIAACASFAVSSVATAQQPNYYNIPLQPPPVTYIQPYVNPNVYVPPTGYLGPMRFIPGRFVSLFGQYIQTRPFTTFPDPTSPAPAYYWDPGTNTLRYGRGYYTPLRQ